MSSFTIYDYLDYQKFLADWRQNEKQKDPGLTHEYLCSRLGRKNRTLFNDIEKGRKKIGSELLLRLIKLLNLTKDEAKYFRALVNYGQEINYEEKEYWFEKLLDLNNIPKKTIDLESYSYFKEWYHTVIRAMLDIFDFKDNYQEFSHILYKRLNVSQIKKSIALLKKLKMVKKDKKGYLKPSDKIIATSNKVGAKVLNKFLIVNNEIFVDILKKDEPGSYTSSIFTLSLSKEGLGETLKRVEKFKNEISSIAHNDKVNANRVYNFGINFYPITKSKND